MDLLLITNSQAGSNDEETIDRALGVLKQGANVEVAATSNADELKDALADLGDRRVVVAGGDGSLHAVVAALNDLGTLATATLGLIPLGTGNDFARGMGIALEPEDAADVVLHGDVREIDVITDETGKVVVNNVHAGASAEASRKGAKWKAKLGSVKLGKLGYPIGAALASFRPPFVRLDVDVDGKRVADRKHPVLMISVGNSSHIGGGTEVTPDATPEDGRIDVMISFAIGPLSRFGYVWKMRKGEHPERDDVIELRGKKVHISGDEFHCSADGEIYGPVRERTWTLRPAAFKMSLPHHGDEVEPE